MNFTQIKLQKILNECDKHFLRLNSAYKKMSQFIPLDEKKYLNLSDDEIEHIDQYLFRFSKVQDTMGEKLFKVSLEALDENIENKPFIDILNRLEKLEILDVEVWRRLRDIRNEISHNYDEDAEVMSIAINSIYNEKNNLENIYNQFCDYINKFNIVIRKAK